MSDPAATSPAAHVVIVDDDPGIREVVGEFLARHGFRVTEVAGRTADFARAFACRWRRDTHPRPFAKVRPPSSLRHTIAAV